MRIAFIPPISLLTTTRRTNYQLCLPQMLLKNPTYRSAYKNRCNDPEQFVILDNGAAESELVNTDTLMRLANELGVDELVIPDVLGDAGATIDAAFKFYDDAVPPRHMAPLRFGLMFVVQGQTFPEVMETARFAAEQDWITSIGIPRHMITTLDDVRARVRIANTIAHKEITKPIHFLGANPHFPTEVAYLSDPTLVEQKYIRGMDTSMPFNYTFASEYVDGGKIDIARPSDYFNITEEKFDRELIEHNVSYFLKYNK